VWNICSFIHCLGSAYNARLDTSIGWRIRFDLAFPCQWLLTAFVISPRETVVLIPLWGSLSSPNPSPSWTFFYLCSVTSHFPSLALSYPEDGSSVFLWNAGTHLLDSTVLQPRISQHDFSAFTNIVIMCRHTSNWYSLKRRALDAPFPAHRLYFGRLYSVHIAMAFGFLCA
jgi:hypothetical protein